MGKLFRSSRFSWSQGFSVADSSSSVSKQRLRTTPNVINMRTQPNNSRPLWTALLAMGTVCSSFSLLGSSPVFADGCGCEAAVCGCDDVSCGCSEPVCGLEERACGFEEPGCGFEEPACGFESAPACGCEAMSCDCGESSSGFGLFETLAKTSSERWLGRTSLRL